MHRIVLRSLLALTAAATGACSADATSRDAAPPATQATQRLTTPIYTFATIEAGGEQTSAFAINDKGTVVGATLRPSENCTTGFSRRTFVAPRGGAARAIFTVEEETACYEAPASWGPKPRINNADAVLVTASWGRPYLWTDGRLRNLADEMRALPECGYRDTYAYDLNDAGKISGRNGLCSAMYDGASWTNTARGAYEWAQFPIRVNNRNVALLQGGGKYGSGWVATSFFGVTSTLSFLPDRPWSVSAADMNDSGVVLGQYEGKPYLHDGVNVTYLPAPAGANGAYTVTPTALSDFGVAVGNGPCEQPGATGACAVVWREGRWTDLNTLADAQGYQLLSASDVNDLGEIVGEAVKDGVRRGYVLRPVAEAPRFYVRGSFNDWAALAMAPDGAGFRATIAVPPGGARLKLDRLGDWSENYGDDDADGVADRGGRDIVLAAPGTYVVTLDPATRRYSAELKDGKKRTVVFIYGQTSPGQDMFVRGGLDHDYARRAFGIECTAANKLCAVPIRPLSTKNPTTAPWKSGDGLLDWYGAEPGQASGAEGSPLDWTTNSWPSSWGQKRTVADDGYGETPLNNGGMGSHYWMLDVEMDCNRTAYGWFELKSFISNGPGWEADVAQERTPYATKNHVAQCGKVNVFRRGDNSASTYDFPQP